MVSSRGWGKGTGAIGGSGRSEQTSSNVLEAYLLQRPSKPWKPWLSPTGDVLNGGVAKLELVVVSVKESALGLKLAFESFFSW